MTVLFKFVTKLALVISLFVAGFAMAQSEPSMGQIYETAQAGRLNEAQVMMQQVLISHPKSAKAHFVQAELFARQGKMDLARQSLSLAEQYAPGLSFAKPESVQALKRELSSKSQVSQLAPNVSVQVDGQSSNFWLLPVVLAAGFITVAYFFFRKRTPESAQQPIYAPTYQGGLSGPQTFGNVGGMQPAYPQPGYPQGNYPSQSGTGLGGRIMGGVATGLAVGAGVMTAEAIGRNLMGGRSGSVSQGDAYAGNNNFEPIPPQTNLDMGGDNFGISDTAWDDVGSVSGNDWDN